MPTPDFRFEIDHVFPITGRGTAVVGRFVSGEIRSGDPACLHTAGAVLHIDEVWLELMLKDGSEERALLLRNVPSDQVSGGAILSACAE